MIVFFLIDYSANKPQKLNREKFESPLAFSKDRILWERSFLADPITGKIPDNIRLKELMFAKTLPTDVNQPNALQWTAIGPNNIGGRTRAIAMDVDNENIILAGGVTGGLWRSDNGGMSWVKVTKPYQLHNVTCIAQDTRPGKTNVWYYGTGEATGSSASESGSYYQGNGVYKSYDGGLTWDSLSVTASNTPHSFDKNWDYMYRIKTDPTNDSLDIVYAATYSKIYRSENGGNNWTIVRGNSQTNSSYFTEVDITSSGVVYATLSSDGIDGGIWRSANGTDYTKIDPPFMPSVFERIVIGVNPSNENEVYFLANTPGSGQMSLTFSNNEEWNSLWKYTYIAGNGADTNGVWLDLSQNIPANNQSNFDNFNAQGSYNMVVAVKPDDSNVVFIGGTNLYRSTDGFTTSLNTTQIGGYKIGTNFPQTQNNETGLPDFELYLNHHPDQHKILFLPSNNNVLINANDGGIYKTDNIMDSIVVWTTLNNSYRTTQLYAVTISKNAGSNFIHGGFQDNGNFITFSNNPAEPWVKPLDGDGCFGAVSDDENSYYFSIQRGRVYKLELDAYGNRTAFNRIDPIGSDKDNFLFINPLTMDPANDEIMYLPEGRNLWRNNQLNGILLNDSHEQISQGWTKYEDTITTANATYWNASITAVAVTNDFPKRVYYGTNNQELFRIDNPDDPSSSHTEITFDSIPSWTSFPSEGNISCIAVDPLNGNNLLVVFSNYKVYSLFYSSDAGYNWMKVAGNLEQTFVGGGWGPSCRWASIFPMGNKTLYFLATTTGIYATDTLIANANTNDPSTIWTQIGTESIGAVVCNMVTTRLSDSTIVVATHGNGVYKSKITSVDDLLNTNEISEGNINTLLYPNPANKITYVEFTLNNSSSTSLIIYDQLGRVVQKNKEQILPSGINRIEFNVSNYNSGIYYYKLKVGSQSKVGQFIVQN